MPLTKEISKELRHKNQLIIVLVLGILLQVRVVVGFQELKRQLVRNKKTESDRNNLNLMTIKI